MAALPCIALTPAGTVTIRGTAIVGAPDVLCLAWARSPAPFPLDAPLQEAAVRCVARDGVRVTRVWLEAAGEDGLSAPPALGRSADVVILAATLLAANPTPVEDTVLSGSGALGFDAEGRVRVVPVEAWAEKLRALAPRVVNRRVILLHPREQAEEVDRLARGALAAAAEVCLAPVDTAEGVERVLQRLRQGSGESAKGILDRVRIETTARGWGYFRVRDVLAALGRGAPGLEMDTITKPTRPASPWDPPIPTPRLAAVLANDRLRLGASADLADALVHVLDVATGPLQAGAQTGDATWDPGPAHLLEVLSGADDGRVLRPEAGQTVGRSAPTGGPDVAIFTDDRTALDPSVSRHSLRWEGDGMILVGRGAVVLRDGDATIPIAPGVRFRLRAGAFLRIGDHTWVRGR